MKLYFNISVQVSLQTILEIFVLGFTLLSSKLLNQELLY